MSHTEQAVETADRRLFDSIASAYAQKDLTAYCRIARKLRLKRTLKNIAKPIDSILEGGCGAGFSADYLRGDYNYFLGVDYSQKLIDCADNHNKTANAHFVCGNIKSFAVDRKFDVILMIGVLHHISDPADVLCLLKSMLKPQGVVLVNEPQRGNPIIGLLRKVRKLIDSNYSSDQIEFSLNEIEHLFRECGYEVRSFPQGVLSTPLAETRLLPHFLGLPLAILFARLDPLLEAVINTPVLRRLAWNVVVEARVIDGASQN